MPSQPSSLTLCNISDYPKDKSQILLISHSKNQINIESLLQGSTCKPGVFFIFLVPGEGKLEPGFHNRIKGQLGKWLYDTGGNEEDRQEHLHVCGCVGTLYKKEEYF